MCVCLVAESCPTLWQPPLSMGFPLQEYWDGLPFLSPGDLPDPGIEPVSPALAGRFCITETPGKSYGICILPLYGSGKMTSLNLSP